MEEGIITVEKTSASFLTCFACGKKHQTLYGTGDEYRCSKCNTIFYDGVNIPEDAWKEEEVDALRCDRCKNLYACISENYSVGSDVPALLCLTCNDGPDRHYILQHTIGIMYNGAWYRPSYFLQDSGRNGILEASGLRDRLTLRGLNIEAKKDAGNFRSVPEDIPAKIYWREGKAVGYYSYTLPEGRKATILRQIFVRRDDRRKGYATEMIKDFMKSNTGRLAIEAPNDSTMAVLLKMGEVKEDRDEYTSTGRLGFLGPQM